MKRLFIAITSAALLAGCSTDRTAVGGSDLDSDMSSGRSWGGAHDSTTDSGVGGMDNGNLGPRNATEGTSTSPGIGTGADVGTGTRDTRGSGGFGTAPNSGAGTGSAGGAGATGGM